MHTSKTVGTTVESAVLYRRANMDSDILFKLTGEAAVKSHKPLVGESVTLQDYEFLVLRRELRYVTKSVGGGLFKTIEYLDIYLTT